tara:strand:+ start:1258 stop:1437 length:180 start_codon:yes stop_codon:yes gene_type:complete
MVLSYSNWLTFELLCYKKEQVKKIGNTFNNIPRGSMNFTGFVGLIGRLGRTLKNQEVVF